MGSINHNLRVGGSSPSSLPSLHLSLVGLSTGFRRSPTLIVSGRYAQLRRLVFAVGRYGCGAFGHCNGGADQNQRRSIDSNGFRREFE